MAAKVGVPGLPIFRFKSRAKPLYFRGTIPRAYRLSYTSAGSHILLPALIYFYRLLFSIFHLTEKFIWKCGTFVSTFTSTMIYEKRQVGKFPASYHLNLWFIYICWCEDTGWLRLFGTGPGIEWKPKHAARLFSERYGYTKTVIIGNYRFKLLR